MNPKIEVVMQYENQILFQAKIIYPMKYYFWVANLVSIKKKNGDIKVCVYF